MNFYLEKCYNDIKDPTWPTVANYSDYFKLPQWIRNECEQMHNINNRFDQIEDVAFCTNLTTIGYKFENLVFVPVKKCASTYYTNLFYNQLGWEEIGNFSSLDEDTVFFGVIMDPTTRWLKGITEFFWGRGLVDDQIIKRVLSDNCNVGVLALDPHSMPYSITFGQWLDKINWFPLDFYNESEILNQMSLLFQQTGHEINLPLPVLKLNKSSDEKLALLQKIKNYQQQNFKNNTDFLFMLQVLFADDLKFYRKLINNISTS
jgi:hypothetical protein